MSMMRAVLRAPGGAGTLGTQSPLPLAVPVPPPAVCLAAKRLGWLWGWEQGARRGTLARGQAEAAKSSCAINTTALLPLTCHQCDRRDL